MCLDKTESATRRASPSSRSQRSRPRTVSRRSGACWARARSHRNGQPYHQLACRRTRSSRSVQRPNTTVRGTARIPAARKAPCVSRPSPSQHAAAISPVRARTWARRRLACASRSTGSRRPRALVPPHQHTAGDGVDSDRPGEQLSCGSLPPRSPPRRAPERRVEPAWRDDAVRSQQRLAPMAAKAVAASPGAIHVTSPPGHD